MLNLLISKNMVFFIYLFIYFTYQRTTINLTRKEGPWMNEDNDIFLWPTSFLFQQFNHPKPSCFLFPTFSCLHVTPQWMPPPSFSLLIIKLLIFQLKLTFQPFYYLDFWAKSGIWGRKNDLMLIPFSKIIIMCFQ